MIRLSERLDWDDAATVRSGQAAYGAYTMAEVLAELLPRYGLPVPGEESPAAPRLDFATPLEAACCR